MENTLPYFDLLKDKSEGDIELEIRKKIKKRGYQQETGCVEKEETDFNVNPKPYITPYQVCMYIFVSLYLLLPLFTLLSSLFMFMNATFAYPPCTTTDVATALFLAYTLLLWLLFLLPLFDVNILSSLHHQTLLSLYNPTQLCLCSPTPLRLCSLTLPLLCSRTSHRPGRFPCAGSC